MKETRTCRKCGKKYVAWRCPRCYKGKGRSGGASGCRKSFRSSDVLAHASCDAPVGHPARKLLSPLDVILHVAKRRGKDQTWVSARVNDSWEFADEIAQRFNRMGEICRGEHNV
jgi:hypothetical protein